MQVRSGVQTARVLKVPKGALAVDLAERSGLSLAGFSRGRSINLYTHFQRIEREDEDS